MVTGVVAWPVLPVSAKESPFIDPVPSDAQQIAPALQHAMDIFQAHADARAQSKQWRAEQDGLKTKLAVLNGELEVLTAHRQQTHQQLTSLEADEQTRFESLRKELETKLDGELTQSRQSMAREIDQDLARDVRAFESRLSDAIGKTLDHEIQMQERELAQLNQEIEMQTQELQSRLARLDASPDAMNAVTRSTSEALAKRRAALEARRSQLQAEGDTRVAKPRADFVERLTQQYRAESLRRLTLKEASLRQSMAELLERARAQGESRLQQSRQLFEEVKQRYSQLAQEQASLSARIASLDQQMASQAQRIESLGADQQASLVRIEQAFQKSHSGISPDALSWFAQVIAQLPTELSAELGLLQQRLVVLADAERQLDEQQRVLRERQLAMQLSHEMESRRQQAIAKQQREQDAKARKAEELLTKARQLAERGRFDESLELVAQAQALNPPQRSQVAVVKEEFLAAKEQARTQVQADELEQLFARAMDAFQQGHYAQAIPLFEQVIAQEGSSDPGTSSVQMIAEGGGP